MPIAAWTNRLLAALFGLVILLPLAALLAPGLEPAVDLQENRTLAARPALEGSSPVAFPTAYEAYFNDNFGFRKTLIQGNSLARYKLFNMSTSEKVIAGQDGWLYYTGGGPAMGTPELNHRGDLEQFGEEYLERMKDILEATRDHFAAHGIDYLLVVAPDKWSIYPEFLPAAYQTGDTPTCIEQFLQYLHTHSTVKVLDLRHALVAAKGLQWPVYLKGDSHWSALGAYTGATEILTTLAKNYPSIKPRRDADYEFVTVQAPAGDLTGMLGLGGWLVEKTVQITPRRPNGVVLSVDFAPKPETLSARQDNPTLPRAIMLRDSYAHAMVPFLSPGFSRIEYVWAVTARDRGLAQELENIKPDIVIEMKVERYMLHRIKYYRPHPTDFPRKQKD